jgi:TRAP-type C4-dicarboxylate transport system permease small subunit
MTNPDKGDLVTRLLDAATSLSRAAVYAGGAITIASVLLISFDVIARKFLGFTTGGADELSSYAFAISTAWALSFAALQRANVRIDFIYQHLPIRLAALLDWVALVTTAVFVAILTRYAYEVLAASLIQGSHANTPLATPLWIPQGLWFLGFVWFCIVLALMLVRASTALVTGDIAALRALCGVRSSEQEAEEEAASGERIIRSEQQP